MSTALRMDVEREEALRGAPGVEAAREIDLVWSFNPWRERPLRSVVAVFLTLAIGAFLLALGLPALVAAALTIAVSGSLAPLVVPRRCQLDGAGVALRGLWGWERRRWEDIGRATWVRGGLLVSPFAEPQRLDAFRALLLPLRSAEREDLTAEIRHRLARHGL